MKRSWIKRKTPLRSKPISVKVLRDVLAGRDGVGYWKAVKRADIAFSKWIRYSVMDSNGIVRCVTCNKFGEPKHMDAGHYISRSHMGTRYDERNVHVQCKVCNSTAEWGKKGNLDEYALFLLKKYGVNILEELNRAKYTITRMDEYQLDLITKDYKERFKALPNAL